MKSLTTSEYYALINDVAKNIGSNATGDDPVLYLEIVKYLRKQDHYDDKSLKAEFGYVGPGKSTAWRTLKRAAINQILRAIELAPANETAKSLLQKAPTLIRILSGKEVWERTSKITDKYIALARKQEEFHLLVQLLGLKQNIVLRQNEPETATLELAVIKQEREAAAQAIQHEEGINDLWLEVSVEARKGAFADKERIREILGSPELEETRTVSRRAEMTYWNIQRTGNFILQDNPENISLGYINGLNGGIEFAVKYLDDPDIFELFLNSGFDRIQIHLFQHEFKEAEALIGQIRTIIKEQELASYKVVRIESRLFTIQMVSDRIKLDDSAVMETCKEFDEWVVGKRFQIDEQAWEKMISRGALNLYYAGDFSKSAKWIFRIRDGQPSKVNPQLTHFSWILYLIARFTQGEHEILKRELKATEKYLDNHVNHPELYRKIVHFIKKCVAKPSTKEQREAKILIADEIEAMLKLPQFQVFKDHFPYVLWLRSESHEEFKQKLAADTKPFSSGQ